MADTLAFFSFISFIVGVILFIVFLNLSSNVGRIRKIMDSKCSCKTCKYESKNHFDFCPVCGKNDSYKTLETLKDEYQKNEHV
jgi:rRNA maturation endonuclease Nob1